MSAAAPTIELSFRDVVESRAFVHLDGDAKVALCHRAGAPWNDKKPKARLHKLQQEVLHRPERSKYLEGGSRLGKSVLGGCEGVCESMLPDSNLGVIAQRYEHVGAEWQYIDKGIRNLFPRVKSAFPRLQYKNTPAYHAYEFASIWRSKGQGFSMESDEGASLLGRQFSRVIAGEGSNLDPGTYDRRVLRAIDGALGTAPAGFETGYQSLYTTPRGEDGASSVLWDRATKETKNKPEKLHYGLVPFAETVYLRTASVLENPDYDRGVFEARRKQLEASGEKAAFEEQYMGLRTARHGMIFKEFDRTTALVGLPPAEEIRRMQLAFSFDTGAHFGGVLLGLTADGTRRKRYVLTETYTEQATIFDSLDDLRDKAIAVLRDPLGLPEDDGDAWDYLRERVELYAVDPASQHKPEITAHWDIALQGWDLDLIASIDKVRVWMQMRSVFIVEDECPTLIDQIARYKWKVSRAITSPRAGAVSRGVTEPKKVYDHVIDAFRGGLHLLEDLGPLSEEPAPVTLAEAFAQAQREGIVGPLRRQLEDAETRGGVMV